MSAALDREQNGRDWPGAATSHFVMADGLRCHVQIFGDGPDLLLLHGTGASTHSWRDVIPRLADRFRVIAPDLPGHGFTAMPGPDGLSLPGMTRSVAAMLSCIEAEPTVVVGHSAGAAIAISLAADRHVAPQVLIGINAALRPFGGAAAQLFSPMARLLFANPFVPRFFAWRAQDQSAVERLIDGTGSRLTPEGLELYRRLFANSSHVEATLGMMASWDLSTIDKAITRLTCPLALIVGERDKAVSPEEARELRRRHPGTELVCLSGLGHLCHEERPDIVASHILRLAGDVR